MNCFIVLRVFSLVVSGPRHDNSILSLDNDDFAGIYVYLNLRVVLDEVVVNQSANDSPKDRIRASREEASERFGNAT